LAGLLDNTETRSLSKVPVLGDIPVLGELFKSKSFQKNETELMFIVTAQLVKPVNRDDLPQLRGIDGLKKGSPLGVEPKGEEIQGNTGFSVTGQNKEVAAPVAPIATPVSTEPTKTVEPAAAPGNVPSNDPKAKSGTEATGVTTGAANGESSATTRSNPTIPAAPPVAVVMNKEPEPQPQKP